MNIFCFCFDQLFQNCSFIWSVGHEINLKFDLQYESGVSFDNRKTNANETKVDHSAWVVEDQEMFFFFIN